MKTSRYTEAQIIAILRQAEGGVPVAELCREHGMSNASFFKWRAKYGGMDASLISQMNVNRHAKLTPYRRTKLTPLATSRSGPEPTQLITEWRRVRP